MAAVAGESRISYDARGLAEPHAEAPRVAEVADGKATFDARDLSTRQINLELRRLLYEEGVEDVTVLNPRAKHSLGSASSRAAASRSTGRSATSGSA